MLGTTEWVIIGGVAILLFGAPKVIDWARTLGKASQEFKKARNEDETTKET